MSTHNNKASKSPAREPLLSRYIGLETEYATVVQLPRDQIAAPSRRQVYESFCKRLSVLVPVAKACFDDCHMFLATGGALSLESSYDSMDRPGGLIEGATPECSSPHHVLVSQRAQDRLFAEAVACCDLPASIHLLKNSRDCDDHVYGCQENYSANVATGVMLWVYRLGMLMLIPLYAAYIIWCLMLTLAFTLSIVTVRIASSLCRFRSPNIERILDFPPWCIRVAAGVLRIFHAPLTFLLGCLARFCAFRSQRRWLTPFLVSRTVLCGSGHLDARGRFGLSGKAQAINTLVGMGGYYNERPVFVFGHWLQALCGESIVSTRSLFSLLGQRQRLQIGASDSNVADAAEYLKIGATSLVLDMIEAGHTDGLPIVDRPLEALHRIAGDWHLLVRVPTSHGPLSGIDIQRIYLNAVRRFVRSQLQNQDAKNPTPRQTISPQQAAEAETILELWQEMLDASMHIRSDSGDYHPALARIDWASKKWLIDQMGADASLASRKKVDLKYHELTANGYCHRLTGAMSDAELVGEDEVAAAMRMPPTSSPAMRRGYFIREFADSDVAIRASWSQVVIGSGRQRRTIAVHGGSKNSSIAPLGEDS